MCGRTGPHLQSYPVFAITKRDIGGTDDRLVGKAIDFESGRSDAGAPRHITIESLYATLAASAGIDAPDVGYEYDDVIQCAVEEA